MQDNAAQFQALKDLQIQLRQVTSIQQVLAAIEPYCRKYIGARGAVTLSTDLTAEPALQQIGKPIGCSQYWLRFEHTAHSHVDAQIDMEMLAAILAAAPPFAQSVGVEDTASQNGSQASETLSHAGPPLSSAANMLRRALSTIDVAQAESEVWIELLRILSDTADYHQALAFIWDGPAIRMTAGLDFRLPTSVIDAELAELTWGQSLLVQEMIVTGETIYLEDVTRDSRWRLTYEFTWVNSWIGIPLTHHEDVIGIIIGMSAAKGAFGAHAAQLASSVASYGAVALENSRVYQRTRTQMAELSTLYQATANMTADLDPEIVLKAVANEMVRALAMDSCAIFAWDEERQGLKLSSLSTLDLSGQLRGKLASATHADLSSIKDIANHPVIRRVFQSSESVHFRRHDLAAGSEEMLLLLETGMQLMLLLPLSQRDRVIGLVALGESSVLRELSSHELKLARTLANQASVALQHVELFGKTLNRLEELTAFQDVVVKLDTPFRLDAMLDAITEAALKLVNASNLHIYLYNLSSDSFTFGSAMWRDGSREPAVITPRKDGLTSEVVRHAEPIVINDTHIHPLYQTPSAKKYGIHAVAGFPLKHGDQVIGVFSATYLQPHQFADDELLLLGMLANQAAVAVRNAGLFNASQRRLRDMSALVDMAKQVTSSLKLNDVLQTTVETLQGLLNARASTITMLTEDGSELEVAAAVGVDPAHRGARMRLGEGVSGEVVRQSQLIYVKDAHSDPNFLFFDSVVRSLLVVPLVVRDKAIGTMTVDSAKVNAFSDSDLQLMTVAAAQVSVAISNARVIEELEERAAELAVAYEELKESDRLKDELVQNVSHELRTPLTFVKGYAELVLDGTMGEINERQQGALKIVSEKSTDIARLIEDIIVLQRISASNLQLETVSLSELVAASAAGHSLAAESKGIKITCTTPRAEVFATLDKARMNQVLDNLIGNAMKFSPDGGTISIALQEADDSVRLVISDQGIGVPNEKQTRIFERFYQVDGTATRRFGGTGVGLAIVKRVVDAHQGQVWVESKLGTGSTFFVMLPKLPGQPQDLA